MAKPTFGHVLCVGQNYVLFGTELDSLYTAPLDLGYSSAVGQRIVVVSHGGDQPSDTQSHTYEEILTEGSLRMWDCECVTALANGTDSVTVNNSRGFVVGTVNGVDHADPHDGTGSGSGSTNLYSGTTFNTSSITSSDYFRLGVWGAAFTQTTLDSQAFSDTLCRANDTVDGGSATRSDGPPPADLGALLAVQYQASLEHLQIAAPGGNAARTFRLSSADLGDVDIAYGWGGVVYYRGLDDARRVSFHRRRDTLSVLAHVRDDTSLRVTRYDDVGVSAGTVTVVSSGATSCSLLVTRDNVVRLFFTADDAFKRGESRDGGSTWGAVTTIASGYDACTVACDETSGLLVAGLYVASSAAWYVSTSSVADSGTWSTPASIATSATASGEMRRRRDGVWEFAYVNSSDAAVIIRSRNVSLTSGGTWS